MSKNEHAEYLSTYVPGTRIISTPFFSRGRLDGPIVSRQATFLLIENNIYIYIPLSMSVCTLSCPDDKSKLVVKSPGSQSNSGKCLVFVFEAELFVYELIDIYS